MLLPAVEELSNITHLDIAGFMEPADEVGGDYYDIWPVNNHLKLGYWRCHRTWVGKWNFSHDGTNFS
jgi:serine phosphatase RsbU (regulator of sigma subunit)